MDLEQLRARIIAEGIASVHKHETIDYKIRGCLEGFRIAQDLPVMAFEETIANRRRVEMDLYRQDADVAAYWEYTCATAQIRHVWERLRIVLGVGPEWISGNALAHVHQILVQEEPADAHE